MLGFITTVFTFQLTWVPNKRKPSWANAKNTMKNMTAKPATSPAQRESVLASWVIVWGAISHINGKAREECNIQLQVATRVDH